MSAFGLIGRKLSHSFSPFLHEKLGSAPYALMELEPEMVPVFLRNTDWDGMNVTIPYKKTVLPLCAELSETARRSGSVNTLLRCPGGWRGENTDCDGFLAMLRLAGLDPKGKKVLIFGSGGVSGTVKLALEQSGADSVTVISRTGPENYGNLSRHADAQLLVNCTPVGMYPENGQAVVSLSDFPKCEAVADLIYNPARTALLLDAEARSIPHTGGLSMLAAQAIAASALFLGKKPDWDALPELLRAVRLRTENIVLIGMPGCGKTSVGQALSLLTGRAFFDADTEIEKNAGMRIPEIFRAEGEAGFRARETAVLAELGKRSGIILATGGGAVTREENIPLLRQNGTLLHLTRPTELLATDGRPVSQAVPLEELARVRMPLYAKYADRTFSNTRSIEETAKAIAEALL